jgi:hypothetical protein
MWTEHVVCCWRSLTPAARGCLQYTHGASITHSPSQEPESSALIFPIQLRDEAIEGPAFAQSCIFPNPFIALWARR